VTDEQGREIAREVVPGVATELVALYSTMWKMLAATIALVVALIIFELASSFGDAASTDALSLYGSVAGGLLLTVLAERVRARLETARRATVLASDPTVSWQLTGNRLVAAEATFAVALPRRLRAELLSVPRAAIRGC
jgi:hypothetical protein